MFCQKCGKQIDDGGNFCPYCGSKNILEPQQEKQGTFVKKEIKKKKKMPVIIIAIFVFIILGVILFAGDDSSKTGDQLIALVQNGYLGNYDTVAIKDVVEYADESGQWDVGEATAGDFYIVEYKGNDITIQFSVSGKEERTFRVSGFEVAGLESSGMEAYDVKVQLDGIYQLYASAYPEKGLHIDTTTSNNTLEGHAGPIKAVEEDAAASSSKGVVMEDLSVYADYTEDKLIAELGYKKNEYGIYPEESHVIFMFADEKMYLISIRNPEDIGMSLCGVNLQNSVEEADEILESKGFVRKGEYEGKEAMEDAPSGMIDATQIIYVENATGYSYTVSADEKNNIISLVYGLEAEEPIYEEQQLEEFPNQVTEPLTYGTYSCDDGAGTVSTAEVGFYPDEGDYIYIDCWSNDYEIAYFNGILEKGEEHYYAYCEEIDTDIVVTFADGGLYVQILDSNFPDIDKMEGFYNLESALNLNEVG